MRTPEDHGAISSRESRPDTDWVMRSPDGALPRHRQQMPGAARIVPDSAAGGLEDVHDVSGHADDRMPRTPERPGSEAEAAVLPAADCVLDLDAIERGGQ